MVKTIQNSTYKKNTIDEIVILRAISCIFVILVHTTASLTTQLERGSILSIMFTIINTISIFSVPSFILISGFVLFYKYESEKINIFSFYYKRLKSIIVSYVVWNIIYYIFFIKYFDYEFSWGFFIEKLVLGDMVYHLYFSIVIIQLYILFPILKYLYERFNKKVLNIVFLVIAIFTYKYLEAPYRDIIFLKYIFFFISGFNFAIIYDKLKIIIKKNIKVIIISYICIMLIYSLENYLNRYYNMRFITWGITLQITSIVSTMFYYYISIKVVEKRNRIYRTLRNISTKSLDIYFSHPLILMSLGLFVYEGRFTLVESSILSTFILLLIYTFYSNIMFRINEKV